MTEKLELEAAERKNAIRLTDSDIAHAIAVMTNIPVEKVQSSEAKLLKQLERHLAKALDRPKRGGG